jgi:GNAT superfamily N-acetyltransferase
VPKPAARRGPILTTEELSESTWKDFEDLFERNGGVWGGCWCTFYQAPRGSGWSSGASNREKHRELLGRGKSHGVIVLDGSEPVGWCQFGPREELPRIDGRRGYSAPDGFEVWRVTCFFVDKGHRRQGVARAALGAALKTMEKSGVKLVEGYPTEVGKKRTSATLLWSGTPALFEAFGFKRAKKLGKSSWIMQKRLGKSP